MRGGWLGADRFTLADALIGAGGVFGQLQEALNTIGGVKAKSGLGISGFLRARFASAHARLGRFPARGASVLSDGEV